MGKISGFGLLELSRQRRRTGILEGSSHICPMCSGLGRVRSVESSSLQLLRALDEESLRRGAAELLARAPADVAIYLLNEKRVAISAIEENRHVRIRVMASAGLMAPDFEILSSGQRDPDLDVGDDEGGARRDRPSPMYAEGVDSDVDVDVDVDVDADDDVEIEETEDSEAEATPVARGGGEDGDASRRRRRGRRGGKRRRDGEPETLVAESAPRGDSDDEEREERPAARGDEDRGPRRRRRRRGRGRRLFEADGGENLDLIASDPVIFGAPPVAENDEGPDDGEPEVAAPEPAARRERPPRRRSPRAITEPTLAAPMAADSDNVPPFAVTPPAAASEPAYAPAPTLDLAATAEPAPIATIEEPYEPDLERREKFFARLNRWGKKG